MAEAARRSGAHLTCHRGCAVCCFGPFPITRRDAVRLQDGLAHLAQTNPECADEIRARAETAIAKLSKDFPGDFSTGAVSLSSDEVADFAAQHSDLACPALSPESGACLVYEHRPIACRTYGPPLTIDGEDVSYCPLCFKHAEGADMESVRVTLNLADYESKSEIEDSRTLIALALR
jgi:Fe-S-cluster containining protein